jgi:hypothetical protein
MFSIQIMSEHPTFTRLMEIATFLNKQISQSDLAKHLNVLDQHVTNWKSRGVPKDVIIDLADEWGFRAKYVRDGEGDKFINPYQYLQKQEKVLLQARQQLPEYARDEMISDAMRKAELIAKAKSDKNGTDKK